MQLNFLITPRNESSSAVPGMGGGGGGGSKNTPGFSSSSRRGRGEQRRRLGGNRAWAMGSPKWVPASGLQLPAKKPSELDLKYQICAVWGLWLPTKGRNGEEGGCKWGASPRGPRGHPCAEAAGSDLGSVATLLKAAQSLNTIISQFALNN